MAMLNNQMVDHIPQKKISPPERTLGPEPGGSDLTDIPHHHPLDDHDDWYQKAHAKPLHPCI